MQNCTYCDAENVRLTKEHLWPASLHKRIDEANRAYLGHPNLFYLAKIDKTIVGEPQIKDVCAECNNGVLSELDGYICRLWDTYFSGIVEARDKVHFEYDYDRLSRWLLKMCYNSSRIHNSDAAHLRECRGYILGRAAHPENVVIHLQLAKPSDFTEDEREAVKEIGLKARRYEPRLNRVGHLAYITRAGVGRLIRTVHLQSYLFLIHIFPQKVPPGGRKMDLEDFKKVMPYAVELSPGSHDCEVECEGLDSKASFYSHYMNKNTP